MMIMMMTVIQGHGRHDGTDGLSVDARNDPLRQSFNRFKHGSLSILSSRRHEDLGQRSLPLVCHHMLLLRHEVANIFFVADDTGLLESNGLIFGPTA